MLPVTGFKPGSSGTGSDRAAICATTTAPKAAITYILLMLKGVEQALHWFILKPSLIKTIQEF